VRLITGFGIGGMLATTNAMVAEFSNDRNRSLAISIMAAGYPTGAIIGGIVASKLLAVTSWHSVFFTGGIIGAVLLPVVWFFMPESIGYQLQKRKPGVLEKVNATLKRLGHAAIDALPPVAPDAPKASVAQLFSKQLALTTILLTLAYAAHIMTFYYLLKWIPKIVVDMGNAPSAAGGVLVWANVGGLCGALVLSMLTRKFGLRPLIVTALVLASIMVSLFGLGQSNLTQMAIVVAIAGFCTNSGVVAFYAVIAHAFPTSVRAGGTGLVIGIGRGGAALGPIVAGLLFSQGNGLLTVSIAMAMGSLLAAVLLLLVPMRKEAQA